MPVKEHPLDLVRSSLWVSRVEVDHNVLLLVLLLAPQPILPLPQLGGPGGSHEITCITCPDTVGRILALHEAPDEGLAFNPRVERGDALHQALQVRLHQLGPAHLNILLAAYRRLFLRFRWHFEEE